MPVLHLCDECREQPRQSSHSILLASLGPVVTFDISLDAMTDLSSVCCESTRNNFGNNFVVAAPCPQCNGHWVMCSDEKLFKTTSFTFVNISTSGLSMSEQTLVTWRCKCNSDKLVQPRLADAAMAGFYPVRAFVRPDDDGRSVIDMSARGQVFANSAGMDALAALRFGAHLSFKHYIECMEETSRLHGMLVTPMSSRLRGELLRAVTLRRRTLNFLRRELTVHLGLAECLACSKGNDSVIVDCTAANCQRERKARKILAEVAEVAPTDDGGTTDDAATSPSVDGAPSAAATAPLAAAESTRGVDTASSADESTVDLLRANFSLLQPVELMGASLESSKPRTADDAAAGADGADCANPKGPPDSDAPFRCPLDSRRHHADNPVGNRAKNFNPAKAKVEKRTILGTVVCACLTIFTFGLVATSGSEDYDLIHMLVDNVVNHKTFRPMVVDHPQFPDDLRSDSTRQRPFVFGYYDIACRWAVKFKERWRHRHGSDPIFNFEWVIGAFHAAQHVGSCLLRHGQFRRRGTGKTQGDGCEPLNRAMRQHHNNLRDLSADLYDAHIENIAEWWNAERRKQCVHYLRTKMRNAYRSLTQHMAKFARIQEEDATVYDEAKVEELRRDLLAQSIQSPASAKQVDTVFTHLVKATYKSHGLYSLCKLHEAYPLDGVMDDTEPDAPIAQIFRAMPLNQPSGFEKFNYGTMGTRSDKALRQVASFL
jgi:hypothetical protein